MHKTRRQSASGKVFEHCFKAAVKCIFDHLSHEFSGGYSVMKKDYYVIYITFEVKICHLPVFKNTQVCPFITMLICNEVTHL